MQIVIEIPEWKYKSICEGVEASKRCGVVGADSYIHEAIYNGTPLPKGHGRLIDEKEVKKMIEEAKVNSEHSKTFAENIIKFAHTIIPADKAESEVEDGNDD